jgi:hypothetical protein
MSTRTSTVYKYMKEHYPKSEEHQVENPSYIASTSNCWPVCLYNVYIFISLFPRSRKFLPFSHWQIANSCGEPHAGHRLPTCALNHYHNVLFCTACIMKDVIVIFCTGVHH